jgi:hypothetical protein
MSDTTEPKEEAKRCEEIHPHFRVSCDLLAGHVKTVDDWHKGLTTRSTMERGSRHTVEQTLAETVQWAPHGFEVPRPERAGEPE